MNKVASVNNLLRNSLNIPEVDGPLASSDDAELPPMGVSKQSTVYQMRPQSFGKEHDPNAKTESFNNNGFEYRPGTAPATLVGALGAVSRYLKIYFPNIYLIF